MKSLQVIVLAMCVFGSMAVSLFTQDFDIEFDQWKALHGKKYASVAEEAVKRLTWQRNLEMIVKHNLEHQRGLHTYRLGMNEFGDMTHEEFVSFFNGLKMTDKSERGSTFLAPANLVLPKSVDWRKEGYVTGVKNQLQCGSCWAFSATGSLEGQHFKKSGKLVSLSEQNLVDCSGPEGNDGCEGGLMDQAFQYIMDNNGIDTEESYPYVGQDGSCHFKASSVGATCTGYKDIPSGDEEALTQAIASQGPISVAIDASHMSFQFYESGVYSEPACSSSQLDHGVLAVGYDSTSDGTDYYIVKNSWGTSWGMKGYIWMSRNKNNQCGIATMSSYPLV
ncbi:cathepsin L-like peptidase [Diadema antillarum]|uniref:cathepsin L-like peptidase n=1 Tax=Diadema antillarum TaxID=105358 RepID=UPI003A890A97